MLGSSLYCPSSSWPSARAFAGLSLRVGGGTIMPGPVISKWLVLGSLEVFTMSSSSRYIHKKNS